jgi:hypothetical protein
MICSGFEGDGKAGKTIPLISSSAPLNFEALKKGFFHDFLKLQLYFEVANQIFQSL